MVVANWRGLRATRGSRAARATRAARAARTPLFAALRRAFETAALASHPHTPPAGELVEMQRAARRWTRREFLGATTAAIAFGPMAVASAATRTARTTTPPPPKPASRTAPRIAIVGAGLAGLNAAYRLQLAGLGADVYDGARRAGGRIFTARDLVGPGLTTELGGEFIDSNHAEIFDLMKKLDLRRVDLRPASEARWTESFFFGGFHHTEHEAVEAFQPLVEKIVRDARTCGSDYDTPQAQTLDRLSIDEYLERSGVFGWLRDLVEVAYVAEYGREAGEQSSLNLVSLASTATSRDRLELFGASDERYRIAGGNQMITDGLAQRLERPIRFDHRLESVRERGRGFTLVFARHGSGQLHVDADVVILAIPFTLLREVDLQVPLSPAKRRAIDELGYGTGAKLLLGFASRPWRNLGRSGESFSDEPYQSTWDHTRLQSGSRGGLTVFCGGHAGAELHRGGAVEQARQLLPGLDRTFPGLAMPGPERTELYHWPTAPFAKGSYACYQPGQWTSIAGIEGEPCGNLLFAGEHCSSQFQGFMNGAAESGRHAAETIVSQVRARR